MLEAKLAKADSKTTELVRIVDWELLDVIIQPVVMAKIELMFIKNSPRKHFVRIWAQEDSKFIEKINSFLITLASADKKFLLETLMEGIQQKFLRKLA